MTKTVNNLDTSPLTLADGTVLNVGDLYVKDSFDDPKAEIQYDWIDKIYLDKINKTKVRLDLNDKAKKEN